MHQRKIYPLDPARKRKTKIGETEEVRKIFRQNNKVTSLPKLRKKKGKVNITSSSKNNFGTRKQKHWKLL